MGRDSETPPTEQRSTINKRVSLNENLFTDRRLLKANSQVAFDVFLTL